MISPNDAMPNLCVDWYVEGGVYAMSGTMAGAQTLDVGVLIDEARFSIPRTKVMPDISSHWYMIDKARAAATSCKI